MPLPLTLAALLCLTQPAAKSPEPPMPAAQTAAPSAPSTPEDTTTQTTEAVVNAPVSELWNVFSTSEGFKALGAAKADIDFRVGGLMRSHYNPQGVIGDEGTIQNQIISFEPNHMISFRIHQPPKGFPFKEAWKNTWSVVTFTDMGDNRTHVRLTGCGYDSTEESQKMRDFFRAGNAYVMQLLQSKFASAASAPSGPAHPEKSLDSIQLDQLVSAPRAEVYKWFTTGDGWKSFCGLKTNIQLKPGGPWEVVFNSAAPEGKRGSEGCTVLSYVPERMVSFTWNAPPQQSYTRGIHTWVVVHFDEVSPTLTRVRLEHLGFAENNAETPGHEADWATTRAYFVNAWPQVLGALAAHAKH